MRVHQAWAEPGVGRHRFEETARIYPVPVEAVDQDSVLQRALELVKGARKRIWITSPWITQRAVNLLLRDALPRVSSGLDVRVVYRVKEPTDLEITDLDALKALEDAGCSVRYSTRLHAKLLLVDSDSAIVSSSNLTSTAGYGLDTPPEWRNQELGVVVKGEEKLLADLASRFSEIWESSQWVSPETFGIVMDFPTARGYSFVAIREVAVGQYATATDGRGNVSIGRVVEITAYNRSFPRMNQSMWLTQGYAGATEWRGSQEIPDLQSLFSGPAKEQGFLVTKTFFDPQSVFSVARVEVLKQEQDNVLVSPSTPVAPGADVRRASPEILARLLGEGDLLLGTVLHHRDVQVRLKSEEILSKHMAVLGMTGSGKSNALKVLISNLLADPPRPALRVVVIDTHGEYQADPFLNGKTIDVMLRRSLLDEVVIKELLRLPRSDPDLMSVLADTADQMPDDAGLEEFAAQLDAMAALGGPRAAKLKRIAELGRERADLHFRPEEGAAIVDTAGAPEDLTAPGLYILNLRSSAGLESRAAQAAALVDYVFERAKASAGQFPTLIVIDEAQNYAPEQQTGWLARVRPAYDALFSVASEGRKFAVGLVVSTQRPARVSKDILSQCNTHVIFRVANVEDLMAIAGSFEAASRSLLDELPGFDTGTCVVGGTAIGMVVRVRVPLFGPAPAEA